jgi:ribonucleotide reductase alpha subunit
LKEDKKIYILIIIIFPARLTDILAERVRTVMDLQVSVINTPTMAIINSINKLLEISACFIFSHPSIVYLYIQNTFSLETIDYLFQL